MPINYEAAKTLIRGLVQKMKSFRGNWNQNDPTADDYIKNRTHWKETKREVIIPETSIEISNVGQPAFNPFTLELQEGSTYEVTWNGNVYQCVAYIAEGPDSPSIGNGTIASAAGGNDEPFFITNFEGTTMVFAEEAGTHTVSISVETAKWHTLDKRYLPTNLATIDEVNNKMDATNPVGTGSFSMNRKADTTIGLFSHAEGGGTTASGTCSHAEGSGTTASRYAAHAEGNYTTASGENSHAEGYYTTASGQNSHAEGCYTIAYGKNSHVEGKYNVLDIQNYAHIVGNGTGSSARSNAHTLDWNGNAWYQGSIKVGGAGWDDATDEVALKSDITNLKGAANGLAELDSTGKIPTSQLPFTTELGYLDGVTSNIQTQLNSKASPVLLRTATLTTANWSGKSQTVSVNGVLADTTKQAIHVSPAPEYGTMYGSAGIECTAQGTNSLTFECTTVPTSNIAVNISIQEATA